MSCGLWERVKEKEDERRPAGRVRERWKAGRGVRERDGEERRLKERKRKVVGEGDTAGEVRKREWGREK